MERPRPLLPAAVAASGVVGLLIYAGLFYANQRRASSGSDVEAVSPAFDTQQQAQQEVDQIQDGGTYTVTTPPKEFNSPCSTCQERRKFELLADEQRRAKIEASYEACLNERVDSRWASFACSSRHLTLPDRCGSRPGRSQ